MYTENLTFPSLSFYLWTGGWQVHDSTFSFMVYVDLPQILAFVTGADCIPPLGFDINPAILFGADRNRLLPVASIYRDDKDRGAVTKDQGAVTEDWDGVIKGRVLTFYCHIFVQNSFHN